MSLIVASPALFDCLLQCFTMLFVFIKEPTRDLSALTKVILYYGWHIEYLINKNHRYMFTFGAFEWLSPVSTYARRVLRISSCPIVQAPLVFVEMFPSPPSVAKHKYFQPTASVWFP